VEQLLFEPFAPKPGSVKSAVLHYLLSRPDGSCRRDFATDIDVYEVSARIGELEADGWVIYRQRCTRHQHRRESHFLEYFL
jgi:hypothetical protein